MRLFIDTWAWLGSLNARDPYHLQAVEVFEKAVSEQRGLFTTDYVLAETITQIFRRVDNPLATQMFLTMQDIIVSSPIRVERISEERFDAAVEMRLRYHDKPTISFTDFTSMVVMRELGITDVLTADRHFEQVGLGFRLVPET